MSSSLCILLICDSAYLAQLYLHVILCRPTDVLVCMCVRVLSSTMTWLDESVIVQILLMILLLSAQGVIGPDHSQLRNSGFYIKFYMFIYI